jgi:AcrR family transcriptional regulator
MLKKKSEPAQRFDRQSWLRGALEVLAHQGQAKLRVDELAGRLGVTKGSFYHHFKNRDDFVKSLLAYWSSAYTDKVIDEASALEGSPEERLLKVMQMIEREGLDRYDIAFRSWAAQNPSVEKSVRKVDLARYRFIHSLFSQMGFNGTDLEDRVGIWLVFHSAQHAVYLPKRTRDGDNAIIQLHAFLTRRDLKCSKSTLERKRAP